MQNKVWILVACAVVVAAVLLLAPTLADLRFDPARPLTRAPGMGISAILPDLRIDESTSVWEILSYWFAIVIPIVLAVLLLPPELRKRVLQHVIRFAMLMLALVLALRYRLIHLPTIDAGGLDSGPTGFQTLAGPAESDVFRPPMVPPWMTYMISLLLVALLALGFCSAYRFWERTRRRRSSALETIAVAARLSLDDLAAGRKWGDVVLEAYARMTDAVRLTRGMHRDAAWTPREFAARLARKGLPAAAVDDLTRLFEAARYGGAIADETARHRAASCLDSILQACRAAA
jgi:hypothetical protein